VRSGIALFIALSTSGIAAAQESGPKQEIGLTLGRVLTTDRTGGATRLELGPGTALQANYGYRFVGTRLASLYGEVHFLANPLRSVTSSDKTLTKDDASLFLTPGIRVKFIPGSAIAPWVAVGAGWSLFEQSTTTLDGKPNPASRHVNHGAFNYGGGVDFKFWHFVGLRAEVRDFYAGSPAYNTAAIHGGQHNVVAGGGLVLRFH